MNFKRLPRRNVLVKQTDVKQYDGEFIVDILNHNSFKPNTGVIVGLNPNSSLHMGSNVFFSRYAGVNVYIGGEHYLILTENEILGEVNDMEKFLEDSYIGETVLL